MAKILLIDVAHLFHVSWHATADQEVGAAFSKTLEKVAWVRGAVEHDHCAICCDWGPYWRHELTMGSYKAQRLSPTEAFNDQFARVRERLLRDGLVVWRVKTFEADDVIATAVEHSRADGHEVTIATGDKDLMQLVSETVSVFSTTSGAMMGAEQVVEKFGVLPHQIVELLSLWGDASDNVPGIPGVGAKKAAALIASFGTGEAAIQAALQGDKAITPAISKALVEHQANYRAAWKLISLRTDVPIEFAELFEERRPQSISKERSMDAEDDELISQPQTAKPPSAPPPPPRMQEEAPAARTMAIANYQAPGVSFEMGLEPTSQKQAWQLAEAIFDSRLYQRFGNAEAIFAVVIRGREMGLGALTALDAFHVIEGKPSPGAHLLIAQARKHPDCEYFVMVDSSATSATYETKNRRSPRPVRLTYTLEQAKQAGLCPEEIRTKRPEGKDGRGQWEKRPDEMLRKTCAVQLARIEYPDAMLGLTAHEEIDA